MDFVVTKSVWLKEKTMTEAPTTPPQSNAANMQAKRKKSFAIFGAILAIVAVGYAIWAFFLNHSVSTEDRKSVV